MTIHDNQEVFEWFKSLTGAKRIELMCGLIRLCIPLEVRYCHTVIEALKATDKAILDDIVRRSNNIDEYKQYSNYTVFNKYPFSHVSPALSGVGQIPMVPTPGQLTPVPLPPTVVSPNSEFMQQMGASNMSIPQVASDPFAMKRQLLTPVEQQQQYGQPSGPVNATSSYSPNSTTLNTISRKNSSNQSNDAASIPPESKAVNGILPGQPHYYAMPITTTHSTTTPTQHSTLSEDDRESVSSVVQSPRSSQSSSQTNLNPSAGKVQDKLDLSAPPSRQPGARRSTSNLFALNRMIKDIQKTIDSNTGNSPSGIAGANSGMNTSSGASSSTEPTTSPSSTMNATRSSRDRAARPNMFRPSESDSQPHLVGNSTDTNPNPAMSQSSSRTNSEVQLNRSTSTNSITSTSTTNNDHNTPTQSLTGGGDSPPTPGANQLQQQQTQLYQGRLSTSSLPATNTELNQVTSSSAKNETGVANNMYPVPSGAAGATLPGLYPDNSPLTVTIPSTDHLVNNSMTQQAQTETIGNYYSMSDLGLPLPHPATDVALSVRSRLIVSLAVLTWDNRDCAMEIFNILSRQLTIPFVTTLLAQGELWDYSLEDYSDLGGRVLTSKLYSEMNLMLAMAIYHPAFTYEQQTILHTIMNELIKWMDTIVMEQVKQGVRMDLTGYPLPPSFWYLHATYVQQAQATPMTLVSSHPHQHVHSHSHSHSHPHSHSHAYVNPIMPISVSGTGSNNPPPAHSPSLHNSHHSSNSSGRERVGHDMSVEVGGRGGSGSQSIRSRH